MKKDWLAAIFAFPSIVLEIIVENCNRFLFKQREVLEGGEHDEEADYQSGTEEKDSGDKLQT